MLGVALTQERSPNDRRLHRWNWPSLWTTWGRSADARGTLGIPGKQYQPGRENGNNKRLIWFQVKTDCTLICITFIATSQQSMVTPGQSMDYHGEQAAAKKHCSQTSKVWEHFKQRPNKANPKGFITSINWTIIFWFSWLIKIHFLYFSSVTLCYYKSSDGEISSNSSPCPPNLRAWTAKVRAV